MRPLCARGLANCSLLLLAIASSWLGTSVTADWTKLDFRAVIGPNTTDTPDSKTQDPAVNPVADVTSTTVPAAAVPPAAVPAAGTPVINPTEVPVTSPAEVPVTTPTEVPAATTIPTGGDEIISTDEHKIAGVPIKRYAAEYVEPTIEVLRPAFATVLQRYKKLVARGGVLSEKGARLYTQAQGFTPGGTERNAATHAVDWQTHVFPELFLLGAPKAGSTQLWDCYFAGLFSKEIACMGTMEPCRRPYLWAHPDGAQKEFGFYDVLAGGVVQDQYVNHFPLRTAETEHALTMEALPRLLVHHSVVLHLYVLAPNRNDLKFMASFREPMARCYSEWRWFYGGKGDESGSISPQDKKNTEKYAHLLFPEKMEAELNEIHDCWPEVEDNPEAVLSLPFPQFYAKYSECMEFKFDNHVRGGLYVLGLRNWLEFFPREAFKFTVQENQVPEKSGSLDKLSSFARFSGLQIDEEVMSQLRIIGAPGFTGFDHTDDTEEEANFKEKLKEICRICDSWSGNRDKTVVPAGDIHDRLSNFFRPYNIALQVILPDIDIPWGKYE